MCTLLHSQIPLILNFDRIAYTVFSFIKLCIWDTRRTSVFFVLSHTDAACFIHGSLHEIIVKGKRQREDYVDLRKEKKRNPIYVLYFCI